MRARLDRPTSRGLRRSVSTALVGPLLPVCGPPAAPPIPQVVPAAILKALDCAIPSRDLRLNKPDTALRYTERRLKNALVYFFFNESGQPFHRTVRLAGKGTKAEIWNPPSGGIEAFPTSRSKVAIGVETV